MGRRAAINARKRRRRILSVSVVVLIIAVLAVLYFVIQSASNSPNSQYIGQPVSSAVLSMMTGVSDSTLNTVGAPSGVTPPSSVSGTPLTLNGKPGVLYVGGDYCPYCAVERWSLIVALSRFGQFSGLEYMLSSATDVNPNSPTFTFRNAVYTSNYISFVAVEEFDRSGSRVQPLTSAQQALVSQYDTCPSTGGSGGIPFVDIGNAYAVNCGAQSSLDISGKNWTQVASQLDTPSSNVARFVDGAANTLISAICKIDGNQPSSVCGQTYASVTLGGPLPSSEVIRFDTVAAPATTERPRWID